MNLFRFPLLGRFCLVLISVFMFVLMMVSVAAGQGSRIKPETGEMQDRDQPRRRAEWFRRGHIPLPGYRAAELRLRAYQQKMKLRAQQPLNFDAAVTGLAATGWVSLGPAPLASDASGGTKDQDYNWVSGRATAVVVDPADATGGTVYLGGAYGGLWRTQNGTAAPSAVSWESLIDDQETLAVGAIALKPGSGVSGVSQTILVGTGEANASGDSYYGLGILRSTNAGTSWQLISSSDDGHSFLGMGFSKIAFHATNPSLVVASTAFSPPGFFEGREVGGGADRGIYYSTNSGLNWKYASVKDNGITINPSSTTSVVFNPLAVSGGKFFAAVRAHGFYSSTDGINWTRLTTQPGALPVSSCPAVRVQGSPTCPIYRGEIAVVPGRNEMYVWYVNSPAQFPGHLIFQSKDGGSTWTAISTAGINSCGTDFSGCGADQGSYNLEIAAVPNGSGTDVYAGAVNIFKCSITSASPTCSGTTEPNKFMNLTHVYGCSPFGSISRVHPDQHSLDFKVVGGKAVMYFAHDGGISRALDGFTGLQTGTCGGPKAPNKFDSLAQTLGSMTEFVSFSQHPTDPDTLLGGTQDNGSPGTAAATLNTQWLNVNGGDGGFNEINPDNPMEWFAANTDVSIQRCPLGIGCSENDFFSGLVVTNATLSGDAGSFYTPYILDPQNSGKLIVGTCRVWRGGTDGIGFGAISTNFDTGFGRCSGAEFNFVAALAAGGPADANGSQAVFAGTFGLGPLAGPAGGQLFAMNTNPAATNPQVNITNAINPFGYNISALAVDPSDPSGNTVWAGLQGFGGSHVWKITNALGGTVSPQTSPVYANFTGSLPDSPVDSVVVDAQAGIVYVGTDVGVFQSPTSAPNWTEVGTTPGLPNAPVTRLRLFNNGTIKRLRASLYGRGIWEFALAVAPDFTISVPTSAQTVYPAQTAAFVGNVAPQATYSNDVNLICTGTVPATCTFAPSTITAANGGFTLSAKGVAGDYPFNVHGVGADAGAITHDFPVTLHVVDFGLTVPSPALITANVPNTTNPTMFNVTAAGSFNDTVQLTCTGLPAGAGCIFAPSASVKPTSATPVTVTLTVSTTTGELPSNTNITISAQAVNMPAPAARTKTVNLVVTANPDYTLAVNTFTDISLLAGQSGGFGGFMVAVNGYNSKVDVGCGAGGPPVCTPDTQTPDLGGAGFSVGVKSNSVGDFSFNIQGVGQDASHITHISPVTMHVGDVVLGAAAPASVIAALGGTSGSTSLQVSAAGSAFARAVTLSCPGLTGLTCNFMPGDTVNIATGAPVNVSVTVTATASALLGNSTVTISATTPGLAAPKTQNVTLTVEDFAFGPAPPAQTVKAGGTASYPNLTVQPVGATFSSQITLSCSGLPAKSNCSFAPSNKVTPGAGPATVTMTIKTTAAVNAMANPSAPWKPVGPMFAFWLSLPALGIVTLGSGQRRRLRLLLGWLAVLAWLGVMAACGGGSSTGGGVGQSGTPPGTYTVTVTGAAGGPSHTQQVTLMVTP